MKVNCRDCLGYIPDSINPDGGRGNCKAWNHYLAKGATKSQMRLLAIDLGNSPDYEIFCNGLRDCKKFKAIKNPATDKSMTGLFNTTEAL